MGLIRPLNGPEGRWDRMDLHLTSFRSLESGLLIKSNKNKSRKKQKKLLLTQYPRASCLWAWSGGEPRPYGRRSRRHVVFEKFRHHCCPRWRQHPRPIVVRRRRHCVDGRGERRRAIACVACCSRWMLRRAQVSDCWRSPTPFGALRLYPFGGPLHDSAHGRRTHDSMHCWPAGRYDDGCCIGHFRHFGYSHFDSSRSNRSRQLAGSRFSLPDYRRPMRFGRVALHPIARRYPYCLGVGAQRPAHLFS